MRFRIAIAIGAVLLLAVAAQPGAAGADQNDPVLDDLFVQLHQSADEAEATRVARRIRGIWRQTESPRADALMRAASDSLRVRDFPTALLALDEVVAIAPDYAEGWSRRASARYLVGDYAGTVEDLRIVLELEPRHFAALSALGAAYMMLDREREAEEALEAALAIHPHLSGARTNLETLRDPGRAL
jgi:tetratricopeptide (TPR) repeat protein